MADVDTTKALLVMAVQDLFDGEQAMSDRLPIARDHVSDGAFAALIGEDAERSRRQRDALADIARSLDAEPQGGPNIWIKAILDNSDNDAATIAGGRLLDIALIGALRKAKQAERVSYETAIVLARGLGLAEAAATLHRIRDEEQETDEAYAAALERVAGAGVEPKAG